MSKLKKKELLKYLDDMRKLWQMERLPLIDYQPKEEEQAYQQIKEMIQKPEVTEDKKEEMLIRIWIEEKAKELITMVSKLYPYEGSPCIISKSKAKDFICKIVGEIHGRKKD